MPLFVAEQFRFDQRFRDRTAGYGDKWAAGPASRVVDGAGDQFLAGGALSGDEHGCVQIGDALTS